MEELKQLPENLDEILPDNSQTEADNTETGQKEPFVIDNDWKAEWAMRKIAEEEAEKNRLVEICQQAIDEYQAKIDVYNKSLENKTSYLRSLLAQYFETVPHKKTKIQETYLKETMKNLLNG